MIGKIKLIFKHTKQILSSYYVYFLYMIVCATLWVMYVSYSFYINKFIIDAFYLYDKQTAIDLVKKKLIFFLSFGFVIQVILYRIHNYLVNIRMKPELKRQVIEMLFRYIANKNHYYFINNPPEKIAEKIRDFSECLPELISLTLERFYQNLLSFLIPLFTMLRFGTFSAFFITATWAISFIVFSYLKSKILIKKAERFVGSSLAVRGHIADVVVNNLAFRLFSRQKYEKSKLESKLDESQTNEALFEWEYAKVWLFYGLTYFISVAVMTYFLIRGFKEGTVTVGQFALIWGLNGAIVNELWNFIVQFAEAPKHIGKIVEAINLIILNEEVADLENKNLKDFKIEKGEISFEKVNFAYKNREKIFKDLSFTVKSKEKVALVGYSGSGKTTLVNLILHLYKVKEGKIKIDDLNINDITLSSLYNSISFIPQTPMLFKRSIKENIMYGKLDATMEEIVEAAKKASIHSFISGLQNGYDTEIGKNGFDLSGGQRQRIIIARAFLKDAPILILDEATSSLDSLTERKIQESLNLLMEGKTVIIIAHRLSTIANMDRILVFENGKVIQDGAHSDLINQNGLYKELWSTQTNVFLMDKTDSHL